MRSALEITSSGLRLNDPTIVLLALSAAPAVAFLHTTGRPFLTRSLDALARWTYAACRFLASLRITTAK